MVEGVWEKFGAFVHQQIVWAKDRGILTRSYYLWQHEPCFFGWLKGNKPPRVSDDYPSTVWKLPTVKVGEKTDHPTSKPIEVFAIPMRQHTRPGEVCYEPFSGSGSQIIAGETTGRRVFAIEISPQYVDVAVQALADGDRQAGDARRRRPHVRRDRRRAAAERDGGSAEVLAGFMPETRVRIPPPQPSQAIAPDVAGRGDRQRRRRLRRRGADADRRCFRSSGCRCRSADNLAIGAAVHRGSICTFVRAAKAVRGDPSARRWRRLPPGTTPGGIARSEGYRSVSSSSRRLKSSGAAMLSVTVLPKRSAPALPT